MTIRIRMTLWYGLVLATVIAVFGASVYLLMARQLRGRLDAGLAQELSALMEEVEEAKNPSRLQERLRRRFSAHELYDSQVTNSDGTVIFKSERLRAESLPSPPVPTPFKRLDFESVPLGSKDLTLGRLGRIRVASELVPGPDSTVVIQAVTSLASDEHELSELLMILLLAGPFSLASALVGGYLLAKKALAPVERMAKAAGEITAKRLGIRLEVPSPSDELGRLATTLNDMIARLEHSFEEIRRFTADAAHELRTPLAVLRSEAEVALRMPRDAGEYRRVIETMLEEVLRLSRLAEQLLSLCREDAGLVPRVREPVRLDDVLRDVAEHMRAVAKARGLSLDAGQIAPCRVLGDGDQLRRLLFNVVDNAIKFTPEGSVTLRGEFGEGRVRVVVSDTGVGIASGNLPHVFERFYRVDPARGREVEGTGLGLSIGRSIAEAHGGELRIESTLGVGTNVSLVLPLLDRIEERGGGSRPPTGVFHGTTNGHGEFKDQEDLDPCRS
jgi:two-component system heavy metal sensor histidine kinase CusS